MKSISSSNDSNDDVVVVTNHENVDSVVFKAAKMKIVTDSNGLFEECIIDMDNGVQHSTKKKSELLVVRAILLRTFQEKVKIECELNKN